MLSAGFLAGPLILNNADMANLQSPVTQRRALAYSVKVDPWARKFWRDEIPCRLYHLQHKPGKLTQ
jgi:hypothetical protein